MRIRYDAEMYHQMFPAAKSDSGKASAALQQAIKEEYFSATIKAIELVSLPQRLVVAELPWDGSAEQTSLTWSRDSKWCAFYASTSRWGLTWIYHLRDDKLVPVSENVQPGVDVEGSGRKTWTTPLEVDVEGDVRREWLKPVRWVNPASCCLSNLLSFAAPMLGRLPIGLRLPLMTKPASFKSFQRRKFHRRNRRLSC